MSELKKRFRKHLAEKGKIPASYCDEPQAMAFGGEVHDEDEWEDGDWNDHSDTSGEPVEYMAFGGKVPNAGYGKPNFPGPDKYEQEDDTMSGEEIAAHMAKALMKRRR